MSIKIGPPVGKEDFYGRDEEITLAKEELFAGNHLSVNAPRRVGKSSFVLRLKDILKEEHDWDGVFIDMEGAVDEIDFAKRLIEALKGNKAKALKSVWEALVGLEISIKDWIQLKLPGDTANTGNDLLLQLGHIINKIEGNFIIVIDELPVFLQQLVREENGLKRVDKFLRLLRSYRINQEKNPDNKTNWIFCGSIGLEYFTQKYGVAGGINELKPFGIGAFREPESLSFLKKLSAKEQFVLTDEQLCYMIEKTGWPIPFFLAILFEETRLLCRTNTVVEIIHIDSAYGVALNKYKNKFETWYSRLKDQLEPDEFPVAVSILDMVSVNRIGVTPSLLFQRALNLEKDTGIQKAILDDILELLIHDGYLVKQDGKYLFRSPFIRDWWINRRNLE